MLRQNQYKRIRRILWLESPLIPGFPSGLSAQLGLAVVSCCFALGYPLLSASLGTGCNVPKDEDEVPSRAAR